MIDLARVSAIITQTPNRNELKVAENVRKSPYQRKEE